MNSSLKKALVASMLLVGGAVSAIGQGWDYDAHCIDPNATAPYSADFITYNVSTPLWEAGLGVSGTVAWKSCVPGGPGGSVPVSGRFQFGPGIQGSIQDDLRIAAGEFDVSPDNFQDMQYGANNGAYDPEWSFDKFDPPIGFYGAQSGSGWSFARIQVQGGSDFLFGSKINISFQGQSNRYFEATQISNNATTTLQIDVVGDASRFEWTILNQGTTQAEYGLELGQWVVPKGGYLGAFYTGTATSVDNYGEDLGYINSSNEFQPYVLVPGLKPRTIDQIFVRTDDPANFPPYVDFTGGEVGVTQQGTVATSISPQLGGGMEIVNSPYRNVQDETGFSDQTPADEFDIGDVEFLLSGNGINANPTFGNQVFNDVAFSDGCAFTQKWYYAPTNVGSADVIVGYYRSVWGDSNYFNGYAGVVDTPKVLSATQTAANTYALNPNPFQIVVDVDNTGVFGYEYTQVDMGSCEVDLTLPSGMYQAGGSHTQNVIKEFISGGVPSRTMRSVTFNVAADPSLFGPLQYTVVIKPTPGLTKTITGTINVAATPKLNLALGANLVSVPWTFTTSDWGAILGQIGNSVGGGGTGGQPDTFEAYVWDPTSSQYIGQYGPARGIGTWVVTNSNFKGIGTFLSLGNSPQQPNDQFPPAAGAPPIQLVPGWNMIGNPYNYSFPLGQIVGAPLSGGAYTYSQLVTNNIIEGSFSSYDPLSQSYTTIGAATDEMPPNQGFWVFCTQATQINFPPIFDLFVRGNPTTSTAFQQYFNHYKLQLSTKGTTNTSNSTTTNRAVQDLSNFIGVDTVAGEAKSLSLRKPPMAESNVAIRTYITPGATNNNGSTNTQLGSGINPNKNTKSPTLQSQYGQFFATAGGKQVFNYNVYASQNTKLTVSWPNISAIPKNLAVQVVDLTTKATYNARASAGVTFQATANVLRTFQVTLVPQGAVRQVIGNVVDQVVRTGGAKQMKIGFITSSEGAATLQILQNGKVVGTVATNTPIIAGNNVITWPMVLNNGKGVTPGSYTLAITALGDGGDTASKLVPLNL